MGAHLHNAPCRSGLQVFSLEQNLTGYTTVKLQFVFPKRTEDFVVNKKIVTKKNT